MKIFTIRSGEISVVTSDTDEILFKKAQDYLPQALKRLGEKVGQEAWGAMESQLGNSSLKFTSSSSEKSKFIREAAAEFVQTATVTEKNDLAQTIFEQLQRQRNEM